MKKQDHKSKYYRLLRIFWYYKKFNYYFLVYGLILTLFVIYIIGAIHYNSVENDLKLEEANYSNSLRNEVRQVIDNALRTKNFLQMQKDWEKYKNKLQIMVQDYYTFKIYYDSHEKYDFIVAKKELDFLTIEESGTKYEVSIYSIGKRAWDRVYISWLKYFTRSFRSSSKYKYLTIWLFILYPISVIGIHLYSAKTRIKKFGSK